MNIVSRCCLKPIVVGFNKEYPLGGTTWYQLFKADICEGCGREIEEDPVAVCDCCGLEPDEHGFIKVDGDDYCYSCAEEAKRKVKTG